MTPSNTWVRKSILALSQSIRDDCVSTWRLREWLERLRSELEVKLGRLIPRPEPKSGSASEDLEAQLTEIAILKDRLVAGPAGRRDRMD